MSIAKAAVCSGDSLLVRFSLVVAVILCAASGSSQTTNGRVVGVVTDPSGAVITGAKVIVTNTGTQVHWETTTRDDGSYQVLDTPIGYYSVSVRQAGFQTAVSRPSELQINQSLRVDVTLKPGGIAETITVESESAQVETVNPTVGATVVGAAIQELPLNGRDTMTLAATLPGISGNPTGNGQFEGASGEGFSIAGGRSDAVSFLVDGANNNSVTSGGINYNPNPDTVAEFRILMNNYTAEYGRTGGGIVSVVTKSGTNQVHGSLFEYLRNQDFNANDYFANLVGAPIPVLKRNQFGATLGGPIVIPKVVDGKDKFFFFFGWQSQRQVSTSLNGLTPTYTPAELGGDFSQAVNGGPDPNVVAFLQGHSYYQSDPSKAAEGIIDPTKLDAVFSKYVQANLIPISPTGSFLPQLNVPNNTDEFTGKFDFLPTSADHISLTLGYYRNPFIASLTASEPSYVGFPSANRLSSNFVNLSYIRTITPNLINEAHASVNRYAERLSTPATKTPLPNALGVGINSDAPDGPTIISLTAGPTLGFDPSEGRKADNTYAYSDTLTWIKGEHTFRGGASLAAAQENSNYHFEVDGGFFFYGVNTLVGSGNALADFEFGLPDEYSQYPSAYNNLRQKQFAAFFQDEWKVKPRLLLTLGVRYEYSTPQRDTEGRSYSLVPGVQSKRFVSAPVGAVFPGDPGAPSGLYFPDRTNFSPRLGFAWDAFGNGKTSIRGGFGMFYSVFNGWSADENNGVAPFWPGVDFGTNGYGGLPPGIGVTSAPQYMENPYGSNGVADPFPSHQTLSSSDPNYFQELGALPFGSSQWIMNPHLKTPYIYQYNLSVQHQLAKDLVLEVGYVGSDSHRLMTTEDGNPMILGTNVRILNAANGYNPANGTGFSAITHYITNDGAASYSGLLASITKHFGDVRRIGTTFFTLAYTYSHNIDNSTGDVNFSSGGVPYYAHNALRGNSAFDQRQRFTLSGGWELPFAEAWSSGPKALTRGWTLYPIFTWHTGQFFDIPASLPGNTPINNIPGPSGAGDTVLVRAQQVTASVQRYRVGSTQTINGNTGLYYFDPNDFTVPAQWRSSTYIPTPDQRTYGVPRDSIPGVGLVNLDLAIVKKNVFFHERLNSELRFEAFNALNHPEFANPSTDITNPAFFGQIVQTVTQTGRVGQIALRITF